MKLLVDPLLHAHFPDNFDISRTRAESQPVEGVENLLIFAERLFELAIVCVAVGGQAGQRRQHKHNAQVLHWDPTTNNAGNHLKLYSRRATKSFSDKIA
jgi:hypothetical protein